MENDNKYSFQLRIYVEIPVVVEVRTGLFIGGLESDVADNPIIKDKYGYPYIPGSSIKGRIRSILELLNGNIDPSGGPRNPEKALNLSNNPSPDELRKVYEDVLARVFGYSPKNNRFFGPTRIYIEDFVLEDKEGKSPLDFMELKPENQIDRYTGQARNPRIVERIIPGSRFRGRIKIIAFDVKEGDKLIKDAKSELKEALELALVGLKRLERLGLGGKISRGYGQIKIRVGKVAGKNVAIFPSKMGGKEYEESEIIELVNSLIGKYLGGSDAGA